MYVQKTQALRFFLFLLIKNSFVDHLVIILLNYLLLFLKKTHYNNVYSGFKSFEKTVAPFFWNAFTISERQERKLSSDII